MHDAGVDEKLAFSLSFQRLVSSPPSPRSINAPVKYSNDIVISPPLFSCTSRAKSSSVVFRSLAKRLDKEELDEVRVTASILVEH
jgi:hypothetical protein